ncbi:hypothetical protein ACJJIK_19735 [Microbulbifer sp. ZKSA006]|uniref:hypothetical protein n=1 Tax=Microbulbifer sp. ZKSA006 TaxID=3243390 RepID=UPI0040397CF7
MAPNKTRGGDLFCEITANYMKVVDNKAVRQEQEYLGGGGVKLNYKINLSLFSIIFYYIETNSTAVLENHPLNRLCNASIIHLLNCFLLGELTAKDR